MHPRAPLFVRAEERQAISGLGEGAAPGERRHRVQPWEPAQQLLHQLVGLALNAPVAAGGDVDGVVQPADQQALVAGGAQVQVGACAFPHHRGAQPAEHVRIDGIGDEGVAAAVACDPLLEPALVGIAHGQHHVACADGGTGFSTGGHPARGSIEAVQYGAVMHMAAAPTHALQ